MSSAILRLWIAISTKLAGRKIVESICTPGSPGRRSLSAPSTPSRDLERVRALQLLDDEQQAGAAIDDGVADQRLRRVDDLRQVADAQLAPAALRNRDLREGVRRADRRDAARADALVGGLEEPARADHRARRELQQPGVERLGGDLHDLVERDLLVAQPAGPDLDVHVLEPLAPDRDVRDAGHAEQARADLPVRRHRQVHQADGLRRQADLHDPARGRDGLHHERRRRPRRKRRRDGVEVLLDELARLAEVRAALEQQRDVRQLRDRLRADHLDARDAVQRVLERDGDELLDLGRRQPEARGLQLDAGGRELGEDVHALVAAARARRRTRAQPPPR